MYLILDGNIHNVSWYVCWKEYYPYLCFFMYTNAVVLYRFITQQEFYESSWSEWDNYTSNILQTILLLNGRLQN
jgi:hypothetical protein